jgi:glycine betaine/proline transport system substrate-binding protein
MPTRRSPAVLMTVLLLIGALTACGDTDPDGFADTTRAGERVGRFVQQPWPDLVVETEIATQILDRLGYQTSIQEVSVPLAAQALGDGKADAYLGNWWPSQQSVFGPLLDRRSVRVTGTLLSGTEYAPAVPDFVARELGVRSLADLAAHGDEFGHEILGIEPGAPGNTTIEEAIKKNAYGLGEWRLTASSTEVMLAEVTRRVQRGRPVVFLGWSPHWMVPQWKLTFLADPQHVWPGAGQIRVLSRAGLENEDPNLTRFLSQITVDAPTASQWILQVDKQKQAPEEIAKAWIAGHHDVLRRWLAGVTTAEGKPAMEVVTAR